MRITALLLAVATVTGLNLTPIAAAAPAKEVVQAPDWVQAMPNPTTRVKGIQTLKMLNIQYQAQQTDYWCGPAATRMAISARFPSPPSQQLLADTLPTHPGGTDWIGQVTRTLNYMMGTSYYQTKEMPNDPPTQAQRDLLWNDIVYDIDRGWAIVANIVAPANNHPPGYPNYTIYHYFTIIGYDSSDFTVRIADPARFGGNERYWLSFNQLATLIPPKGYSA